MILCRFHVFKTLYPLNFKVFYMAVTQITYVIRCHQKYQNLSIFKARKKIIKFF